MYEWLSAARTKVRTTLTSCADVSPMRDSIICLHPQHHPLSSTCPLHSARHATKQHHGRTCHLSVLYFGNFDAVPSELWCRACPFSHQEDRAEYRIILASELTDVIKRTTFEQTSPFCWTPDLSNESGSWRFGACQCSCCVCGANTHVR